VRNPQPDDDGGFLAPQAPLEMTTWVLSAFICEICEKNLIEVFRRDYAAFRRAVRLGICKNEKK